MRSNHQYGSRDGEVFNGMAFDRNDIKMEKAKAELEHIANFLSTNFNNISDISNLTHKVIDKYTEDVSKAENLIEGFENQVYEIQEVLRDFCFQQESKKSDAKKSHYCNRCDKSFPNPGLLDVHIKEHSFKDKLVCNICGKRYQHPANYDRHMQFSHKKKFNCKYCYEEFGTYQSVRIHENKVHENPELKPLGEHSCNKCFLAFSSDEKLVEHKKMCEKAYERISLSAGPSPAYTMTSPAISVRSLPNLRKLQPKGLHGILSPSIGKVSSPKITLTKLDTSCPFCEHNPFANTGSRDRHIRRLHSNMIHMLSNDRFFKEKQSMKVTESKNKFNCNMCGRGFTNEGSLKYHELVHMKDMEVN
uniref:C2H2-type domain-containing protein n=1 Tax=Parastrongyloides trichosuri TaxID=131310 RepID=A0A0N4ZZ77_PARTI